MKGKTSVAGLVASHPSILQVFKVAWLSMTSEWHTEMDYETYTKYLTKLCVQLGMTIEWPLCEKRFEEPALRKIREANFMRSARIRMAQKLRSLPENFLLVLDDVTHKQQLELFRFNECQSIIATATDPTLQGLDWNVRLDALSRDEALEVFMNELDLPANHVAGWTKEVRMILHYCDYHPLTVRTVGRWCRMKIVTAGLATAIQEVEEAMGPLAEHAWERIEARAEKARRKSALKDNLKEETQHSSSTNEDDDEEEDPSTLLFDILSLMMGPDRQDGQGTSVIFVLCFAAMVVVFPEKVPLEVALLLWEQLLRDEPLAQQEISTKSQLKRRAWYVAEGLFQMGVVSISDDNNGQSWIESYHEAYSDFAMIMAKGLDLGDTFEETCEGWHKAFVTIYFNQRINASDGQSEEENTNSWEYAVEKLPDHIFRANMLSMAETILADENFFQARLDSMGWRHAIQVHIRDCVQLQQRVEDNLDNSTDTLTLSAVFTRTAAMVSSFAEGQSAKADSETIIQVSRALYDIGLALAEHGYFEDAMLQFEAAQSFIPASQSLRASILYGTSWVLLASGDIAEGVKKIRACRHIMEACQEQHPLYKEAMQLYADALIEKCDYVGALDTFVMAEQELLKDAESNWIELGSIYKKKGRLLHTLGRLGEAIVAYETSIQWKQHIGENSHGLAATFSSLGDVQMETTQPTEAKQHYEDALNVLKALDCNPKHVNFTLTSGKLRFLMGDFPASLTFLARARQSISVSPLLVMDQSAYDLRCIARIYKARGDVESAIEILKESLVLTSHRPGSLERALSMMQLGRCCSDLAKHEEAIKWLKQSLDIQTSLVSENMVVAETTMKLGKAYFLNQDFDSALEKYSSAKSIILRVAPKDAEGLAEILYCTGEAHEAKNEWKAALEHYNECISVMQRERLRDHLGIAKAMHAIGRLKLIREFNKEAIPYLQEAIRIRRMSFDDIALSQTLQDLGILATRIGDYKMAEESLNEALSIRKKQKKLKPWIAETMLALGDNYMAQGIRDSASKLYQESMGILDDSDPLRSALYFAMGKLKVSTEKYDEAVVFLRKLLEIRETTFGRSNTLFGRAALFLGVVHFLANHDDIAGDMLNEFVRTCDSVDKQKIRLTDQKWMAIHLTLSHILLGDILYRTEQDDAFARWNLASKFCDSGDSIEKELADMVSRRLKLSASRRSKITLESRERNCIYKCLFINVEPNY